ncbi:MAG: helix-turn-helix domain-containing protein [Clostridiales bacterium]|jgi:DNA-binding transcriptional regulator YiaG|nr:helix-turn-helix domain-containing protein [Clostridiales bacterium]
MKFSEKVIAVRGELYMSQKQLADEIGVSFSTVNRWEQERHAPSFLAQKRFEDYCKKKGIKLDDDKKSP